MIDLPPGTSAAQHILIRELRPDGAIIVVTPDALAHLDGRKAVQMFRLMRVPVIGAVENMAQTACPHCGAPISLFDGARPERTIWSLDVEQLARIPFELASSTSPTSPSDRSADRISPAFEALAEKVLARAHPRDSDHAPP